MNNSSSAQARTIVTEWNPRAGRRNRLRFGPVHSAVALRDTADPANPKSGLDAAPSAPMSHAMVVGKRGVADVLQD
jgi:hypothetical protein